METSRQAISSHRKEKAKIKLSGFIRTAAQQHESSVAGARRVFGIALRLLWRNADAVALFLMMAAVCNFRLSFSDLPIGREGLNALDESWEIDLVYKASHGLWSGRDFYFTYGPLWQYLASVLPRAYGTSAGSIFKLLYLFPHWCSFLLAFFTTRLLIGASEPWRRTLFLIALTVFWLPFDARIGLALFSFAAYVRLVGEIRISQHLVMRAVYASGLTIACFLMASDAGAVSAAGLISVLVCAIVLDWRTENRGRLLRFAGGLAVCTTALVIAVNTWAASPFDFRFWAWNAQMISAYRWLMASPLAPEAAARLLYTMLICAVIFGAGWFTRDAKSDRITMRPLYLVASAIFSFITLQKGVVRPGWGQISQCALPAIALTGAILIGYRRPEHPYRSEIALLAAVALTVIFSGPSPIFGWEGVVHRVLWSPPSYPSCPPGTSYLDQTCFTRREYATFGVPSKYISSHSGPGDSIVVYPYENIFGLLSRRRVSDGILQDYAIGGESLTDYQIATLDRDRPPIGVYCSDNVISWPVDGISNFQRTARVWLYLQSHYMAEAEPVEGVTIVRRDDSRAQKIRRVAHELWRASAGDGQSEVTIDPDRWIGVQADFIRLKVRIDYPFWWRMVKPSSTTAVLKFSDGTLKTALLAVQPDRSDEVWIFPGDERHLKDYFQPDSSRWRPGLHGVATVRAIQLRSQPYDFMSVAPQRVEIDAVDAIELNMRDSL